MKKLTLLLSAFFLIAGCQDVLDLQKPEDYKAIHSSSLKMERIFENFWNGMNNNYAFWDVDPTDWDGVYREYKPKFADLDVLFDEASSFDDAGDIMKTARGYFKEMTKDLIDGHYNLFLTVPFTSFEDDPAGAVIIPSDARNFKRFGADYYDQSTWENSSLLQSELAMEFARHVYEMATQKYLTDAVSWDGDGFYTAAGRIPLGANSSDSILYFQFSNFHWADIMSAGGEAMDVLFYFIANLHAPDIKGVIVDLRGNGGGNAKDLSLIWGQMFAKEKHQIAYSKQKMGEGRLDYAPLTPLYLYSDPEVKEDLKVPLVLLVNKGSVSCSELSALFVRSWPNGFIVGGTTHGGQGPLTDNITFNAGTFSTMGIDSVRTSSIQTLDLNKVSHEGKGIEPDYPVPFDYNNFIAGVDTRLEKAIAVIREKR